MPFSASRNYKRCHASALYRKHLPGSMNQKVLDLVGRVHEGYAIDHVAERRQGGVVVLLARGRERRRFRFEHFEVPAMLQACALVGVAK